MHERMTARPLRPRCDKEEEEYGITHHSLSSSPSPPFVLFGMRNERDQIRSIEKYISTLHTFPPHKTCSNTLYYTSNPQPNFQVGGQASLSSHPSLNPPGDREISRRLETNQIESEWPIRPAHAAHIGHRTGFLKTQ